LPSPGFLATLEHGMKTRIGLIVLGLACLGLVIGLVAVKKQAADQQDSDAVRIQQYSNEVASITGQLEEQKQVNTKFEQDLESQKKMFADLTNNFTQVTTALQDTSNHLATTEATMKEEVAKRDARIGELETANQALDRKAVDLSSSITNLTVQIAETKRKLDASEGDKAFLQGELKRLMAEKAELERQFNDLTVLRAQVSKLKQEMNIARRLQWLREGLFASSEQKGAQKLMQGAAAPQYQAKTPKPAYDLNVEVSSDGSVKVIPPLNTSTNSTPAK
jgi:chromosome segregation ATPase